MSSRARTYFDEEESHLLAQPLAGEDGQTLQPVAPQQHLWGYDEASSHPTYAHHVSFPSSWESTPSDVGWFGDGGMTAADSSAPFDAASALPGDCSFDHGVAPHPHLDSGPIMRRDGPGEARGRSVMPVPTFDGGVRDVGLHRLTPLSDRPRAARTRGGGRGGGGGGWNAGRFGSELADWQQQQQPHGPSTPSFRGGGQFSRRGGGGGTSRGRGGSSGGFRSSTQPSAPSFSSMMFGEVDADQDAEDIPFDDLDDPHSTTALHPSRSSRPWDDPSDADPSSSSSSSREPLQRIDALPAMFRPIFPYPCFNRVQTRCFHRIYYGDENIVIAAPTGSGKTVLFELAILRFFGSELLQQRRLPSSLAVDDGEDADDDDDDDEKAVAVQSSIAAPPPPTPSRGKSRRPIRLPKKCLYVAPIKALCEERASDWSKKFSLHLDLKLVQMTGDREARYADLAAARIIVTTPEKWDALSRRMGQADRRLMASIGLIMVDEIHLLNDDTRGGTLEGLLSRLQLRKADASRDIPNPDDREPIGNLRILTLSATAPNASDVAQWLGGTDLSFNNGHRPVPLEYLVYDYPCRSANTFMFDNSLNGHLLELIRRHASGRPVIVFNPTRKSAQQAAKAVADNIRQMGLTDSVVTSDQQRSSLHHASLRLPEEMRPLVLSGVAYHHGGLDHAHRQLVEQLFSQSHLLILCSTTTLGQGVNLPAHCVIVKSTKQWKDRQVVELDETTIMQMIGRAGRPQFDKKGVAIVMTQTDTKQRYQGLLCGRLIESHLLAHLVEHINAEVVSGSLTTHAACVDWIKSTFMFTRMCRMPQHYFRRQMSEAEVAHEIGIIAAQLIDQLASAEMLEFTGSDLVSFRGTPLAFLTARWYLSFATVQKFARLRDQTTRTTFEDYLDVLCSSGEFTEAETRIKSGDKGILNQFLVRRKRKKPQRAAMMMEDGETVAEEEEVTTSLPFGIPGNRINTMADKIKCLIQIRCVGLHDSPLFKSGQFGLLQDMTAVMSAGVRVARAMDDYMQEIAQRTIAGQSQLIGVDPASSGRLCGWVSLKHAIQFRKSITNQSFVGSPQIFAQIEQVGPAIARKLYAHVRNFAELADADTSDIQQWVGRKAPFGANLQHRVRDIPDFFVEVVQAGFVTDTKCARVDVTFDLRMAVGESRPRVGSQCVHLIIGTLKGELLYYCKVKLSQLPIHHQIDVALGTQIKACAVDDHTVGCDVDSYAYLRYGECVSQPLGQAKYDNCRSMLGEAFDRLEMPERDNDVVDPAQPPQSEYASPTEFGVTPEDVQFTRIASSSTKKEFCKHKAPKCQAGKCKHACCHERFEATAPSVDELTPNELRGTQSYFDRASRAAADQADGRIDSPPEMLPRTDMSSRARKRDRTSTRIFGDDGTEATSPSMGCHALVDRSDPFGRELQEMQGGEEATSLVANKRIRLHPLGGLPSPRTQAALREDAPAYYDQLAHAMVAGGDNSGIHRHPAAAMQSIPATGWWSGGDAQCASGDRGVSEASATNADFLSAAPPSSSYFAFAPPATPLAPSVATPVSRWASLVQLQEEDSGDQRAKMREAARQARRKERNGGGAAGL